MEVRKGYKQTDVGIIPEDWVVKSLGELASITSGGTPSRSNAQYWDGDIPWIMTTEVDFNKIDHAEQFITKEGLNNSAAKLLPPGTLLMALYGQGKTRGKVAVLGIEAATNQACAAIALNRNVSGNFIFRFLSSQYKAIRNLSNIGNQENLNSSLVRSIPIILPTLAEQEAIAEALSDADALIEAVEQLLTKKRQVKQGAMSELLTGKRRLSGFSGEWNYKKLGELSEMGSGGTPLSSNPDYYNGNIPWVSIADMTKSGKFISTTENNLTVVGLNSSSAQMFPKGTVLYAMYASLGECSIAEVPLCTSQAILGIRVKPNLSNEFLFYFLSFLKPQVKTMGQQGTQSNLNKGMVQNFHLKLPPLSEQTAIAEILSDMDAEITALEEKLVKARQVKAGMMSVLLTGKIRLV